MTKDKDKSDPLAHIDAMTPDTPINILKLAKRSAERLAQEQPAGGYDDWAGQIDQLVQTLSPRT